MHLRRWQKQGPILDGGPAASFDSKGVGAHCVVKDFDSRQYFMFYEGFDEEGRRSIGVAVSADGLGGWRRHSEPILQGGEAGAWDEAEVGTPCAVSMAKGRWRLYYSGAVSGHCPEMLPLAGRGVLVLSLLFRLPQVWYAMVLHFTGCRPACQCFVLGLVLIAKALSKHCLHRTIHR